MSDCIGLLGKILGHNFKNFDSESETQTDMDSLWGKAEKVNKTAKHRIVCGRCGVQP